MTSATVNSPFLSDEQVAHFDEKGYLILRAAIDQDLLRRLQEATARLIVAGNAAGPARAGVDYQFADGPSGPRLFRIDYLHAKREPATLELLGCPTVLGVAERLAGPTFVPTYEALVFKAEGAGKAIRWHQDAVHPRNHRIFNIDVYLDSSLRDAGALRVVPGSQRGEIDFCSLEERHGWEPPGVVEVEMDPGDILVHDVMLAHGSEPTVGTELRRTLYYEFRAAEQIMTEGPWDETFVEKRMRLIPLAISEYQRNHADEAGFDWRPSGHYRPPAASDPEAELRVVHEGHSPNAYCSAGDVPASRS